MTHLTVLTERIRLANRQHQQAQQKLEQLCQRLSESSTPDSDKGGQNDVTVLLSLKGIGITVAATLLAEASQPLRVRDYLVL